MPRVRFLRATVASLGVVEPGAVHDLPADEVKLLVGIGKAVLVTAAGDAVPGPAPRPVIDAAPLSALTDPAKPRSRRGHD